MSAQTQSTQKTWLRRTLPVLALLLLMLSFAACQSSAEEVAPAQEPAAEAAAEAPAAEAPVSEEPATEELATEEPAEEAQVEEAPADSAEATATLQTFVVTQDGSEARFFIDEVLFGQDKTVIGVTSDVSGEIRLNPANPSASEIGPITINARDLTTDADRRNGAIRRFVLQSERDENQYITFTPTAIANMPDAVTVGEMFDFQVTGDLQIRDVVREEIFDVTVTPISETELTGLAVTTVLYPDYGLIIPEVPSVTNVEDDVRLEFEFTAIAQ